MHNPILLIERTISSLSIQNNIYTKEVLKESFQKMLKKSSKSFLGNRKMDIFLSTKMSNSENLKKVLKKQNL